MGEGAVRVGVFLGLFVALAMIEALWPAQRAPLFSRRRATNLSLGLVGALIRRILGPLAPVAVAIAATEHSVGLFNVLAAPQWLVWIGSLIMLDLALYAQHLAMHRWPWLWRLHAPHHSDAALDVTSALRFHPLEHFVSAAWKSLVVLLLGAPAAVVVAFEIVLNACAMFNHANVRLPEWLERAVVRVLITPRAHRLHHERALGMRAPNYGFSTPLWDHLFGTWASARFVDQVGLEEGPSDPASLRQTLRQPFG